MVRVLADKSSHGYTCGRYNYFDDTIDLYFWNKLGYRITEQIPFSYYFYISDEDSLKLERNGHLMDRVLDCKRDGKYWKIYIESKWSVRKEVISDFQEFGIEPLEGDLTPLNRFLIDNKVKFSEHPRILFYDLETDARSGWDDLENHIILSVAYHGIKGKIQSIISTGEEPREAEYGLLSRFLSVVAEHDLLVAWNGEKYDDVVLKARAKAWGFNVDWQQVNFLDLMQLFQKYYARDEKGSGVRISYSLDNISRTALGHGKLDTFHTDGKNPAEAIYQAWFKDRDRLVEYNRVDVERMVELDEKFKFIDAHKVLSHLCGRYLSNYCLMMGYLNDAFILKYAKERGIHFPTKYAFFDNENPFVREKIEGAFVMEPITGKHDEVCDLDFASLYPNVIRSFNISLEKKSNSSIAGNAVAANDVYFLNDEPGIFPELVTVAMSKRQEFKKEVARLESIGEEGGLDHRKAKQRSDAFKVLANSMYGILASTRLRYYDSECGEAVTKTARAIILLVIQEAKARGIEVLYSDTDSVFLKCLLIEAEKFSKEMVEVIDKWVESRGGNPGYIRLEVDAEYERIVFVTKKRYFGLKRSGVIDIKGLELVRSDGCRYARELQRRLIDFILFSEGVEQAIAIDMVMSAKQEVYDYTIEKDDLVITTSLTKPPESYKTKPPHVKVCEELLRKGREVFTGMKVPYIVVGRDKTRIKAVHVDEFDGKYDVNYYWKKKIYPPSKRILEKVFPEHTWGDYES